MFVLFTVFTALLFFNYYVLIIFKYNIICYKFSVSFYYCLLLIIFKTIIIIICGI